MWTPEFFVRTIELPRSVDGVVMPNDDSTFDIYLNSRQPKSVREKWLEHEIRHIREDHFYRAMSVVAIEHEAEGIPVPVKDINVPAGMIIRFASLADMLAYYRQDTSRVTRDYAPM